MLKYTNNILIILAVILIYIIGFINGYYTNNNEIKTLNNNKSKLRFNSSLPKLLLNNLIADFLMLAGSITFGLSTFINLIFNGFNLGLLVSNAYNSGMPTKLILALILPHGIFEIPAMLIAAIAGFKIPYEITLYLLDKKEKPITEEDIKEFLKLALISIILIIIAAFVEVYITPEVAKLLM
ncbi:protein of unknown function DUF95 transmembrane [Methanocaldococcus infernus ME]|uniref:Stage II sporulation protein M n=1 Tax=Methanocaldococcus infernus (strain DSM 11812 / JCM 15783 / ME) TaxID=573063 RepID=D5VTR6_METIM|nr:stage II sporulation protein M [Methanocaldococcus infernus]ADG13969.1 protein of unknown function DUF95 transmembrane [Methanocaldococcus infernus ME]